ncbi:MAG TPA: hypothetical protein VLU25_20790 [Acidobacteriota bacterium]|nr:hypothetical protein [Acidobacteriota bacterium]
MINEQIQPQGPDPEKNDSQAEQAEQEASSARQWVLEAAEWEALEEVAMSFHGVMRLIDSHGFDNSTGAEELLRLSCRQLQKVLSGIREKVEED